MNAFFFWLEATRLSVWTRESTSILAYPTILSAHAIGMGLAAGINAAIALHLLGITRGFPTPELRRFVPFMWFGFWMNLASGILLLIAYPTKALTNPLFYLKLSLIGAGMFVFTRMNRAFLQPAPDGPKSRATAKWLAIAALVCWSGAIVSGRLLAYTYTRLFADW
jgi:hypothetical protein